jgi:hypothetical protein
MRSSREPLSPLEKKRVPAAAIVRRVGFGMQKHGLSRSNLINKLKTPKEEPTLRCGDEELIKIIVL